MSQMKKTLSTDEAFQRLSARCAVAACAPLDLLRKMEGWGLDEESRLAVLQRLKEQGYVNEQRYASAYVRDKFNYAGWGRMKIMQGLRGKGFSPSECDRAWQEINEEDYRKSLIRLLISKSKSIKARSAFERKAKLARFAFGRGFEQWLVMESLEELLQDDSI